MRGDHLSAIVKVNLVAVVSGRIVTCGDVNASGGIPIADGKGKLGGGAGPLKEQRVTTQISHHLGGKIREFTGEKTCVVADGYRGTPGMLFPPMPFPNIGGEPPGGANDIVVIHCIRPDAGIFGTAIGATGP